jgi:hypothetical protein
MAGYSGGKMLGWNIYILMYKVATHLKAVQADRLTLRILSGSCSNS